MRHIALVQTGNEARFVQYTIRSAYYHFELDSQAHLVRINASLRAFHVNGPGDLLPSPPATWWKPSTWRQQSAPDDPLTVRCFQLVGRGYVELPAPDLLHHWANFLDESTSRAVTSDKLGHPIANGSLVPSQGLVPSVVALENDLRAMGIPPRLAASFINYLVGVQRTGEGSEIVQTHLWRWLVPLRENMGQLIPAMLATLFFGIQLAVDTPVGALYSGANRSWGVLFYILPIVLLFILRRNDK